MSLYEALDRSGVILSPVQSIMLRQYRDTKMTLDEWFILFERFGIKIPDYTNYI